MRRCWPTWCGACWKTAPTPPSSTASPTSRSRSRSWSPIQSPAARNGDAEGRCGAAARRDPAAARSVRRRAAPTPRHRPGERTSPGFARPAALLATASRRTGTRRADAGAPPAPRRPGPRGAATRPTGATWSATCGRGNRRSQSTTRWRRPPQPRRSGRPPRPPNAPRLPAACRRPDGRRRCRPLMGLLCSRSRQDLRQRDRRSARSRRLPALLRGPGARRFHQRHPPAAGPGGLHQPVELPAGDFQRPGRCGAGRRQPGAGQAGGTDPADRRASRAPAARSRGAGRRGATAAGRAAKSVARAWSPTTAPEA